MNNSICTLFDNILIDIHKFKSLHKQSNKLNFEEQNFYVKIACVERINSGSFMVRFLYQHICYKNFY